MHFNQAQLKKYLFYCTKENDTQDGTVAVRMRNTDVERLTLIMFAVRTSFVL